jgi:carbon-monoxide dehydrogenase medium subunit
MRTSPVRVNSITTRTLADHENTQPFTLVVAARGPYRWHAPAVKLPAFEYHRPSTLAEALDTLGGQDDAKVLAGGQSLLPVLALRISAPAHLVDIGGLAELAAVSERDGQLCIGAGVRQAEVEARGDLAAKVPLLAAALPNIGHRAIRSRGTVCGSLAHADPAAELPAVATVLDAQLRLTSAGGTRTVAAADFFEGYLTTAIADGEILTEVCFPVAPAGQGAGVVEASRRRGDFALVGAAATVTADGDRITAAALALFGVDGVPVRLPEVERALVGAGKDDVDAYRAAGELARHSVEPAADDNGSTAYKQQLVAVMTRRCLARAGARAGGPA